MVASARMQTPKRDLSTWLTRLQACDLMDLAHTTLIKFERSGHLHREIRINPETGRETVVYDPEELLKLPRRRKIFADGTGEMEARAIELFDDGKSINQVVVETREPSARVREWYDAWLDHGGAKRMISGDAHAELVALVGDHDTVAELIVRVRELASKAK